MEQKYIDLARHLAELEGESMSNDARDHFMLNDWLEKYGEDSVKFVDQLEAKEEDILGLAKEIKEDFESGFWQGDVQYYSLMTSTYSLAFSFEKHLAVLTGVGYQVELFSS